MAPPNLDVGRYGVFIWPAYGLSALTLLWLLVDSLLRSRRWRRAAQARPGSDPGSGPPEP